MTHKFVRINTITRANQQTTKEQTDLYNS